MLGAGEGAQVDEQVGFEAAVGVGEGVGDHDPALGDGVVDLTGQAAVVADHVAGAVGGAGDHVLGERGQAGHLDRQAQGGGGQGGADDRGGAAHVLAHEQHVLAGLEVDAAGVEGDALADEDDVPGGAAGTPAQFDQAGAAAGAAADGEDAAEAFPAQVVGVADGHGETGPAAGGLLYLTGEPVRGLLGARRVGQVPGPAGHLGGDLGGGQGLGVGVGVRGHDGHAAQAGRLAVRGGDQTPPVRAQQKPFGERPQRVRFEVVGHADGDGGLPGGGAGDGGAGRAPGLFVAGTGADQQDPVRPGAGAGQRGGRPGGAGVLGVGQERVDEVRLGRLDAGRDAQGHPVVVIVGGADRQRDGARAARGCGEAYVERHRNILPEWGRESGKQPRCPTDGAPGPGRFRRVAGLQRANRG